MRSRGAYAATWLVLALHMAFLLASFSDYRVSIDSGYHVSLARHYAENGFQTWWDPINYGPGGRPNLQGPLQHIVAGALGRLLGGRGDDYVTANTLLALLQWGAAMATLVFFARKYGGDYAGLFGAALLSGSLASISFAVGIPSGWIFIAAPWAIYFFLEERLALSTLCAVAGIYCHLGGYITAPAGILIAALMTRRFRALIIVGAATFVLALPYTIHFFRYRAWYRGEHGHVAVLIAPLGLLVALAGLLMLLRKPRENAFLLAWIFAPIAWLFQDYTRFLTQSMLAGAVIGGIFLSRILTTLASRRWRAALATVTVMIATVFPLGVPALAAEVRQAAGLDYPRSLDWRESKALADILIRDGLTGRLVYCYNHSFAPSLAVFAPIRVEKGHWVEVQPKIDPANDVAAEAKVYVMPLAPDNPMVRDFVTRGWVQVHGGTAESSIVTLAVRPALASAAAVVATNGASDGAWLSEHAANNTMDPVPEVLFSKAGIAARRARLREQRFHAGQIELAILLYAYAAEPISPKLARGERMEVRGWASLATFLSDESALDFVSADRHARLKTHLRQWSDAVRSLRVNPYPDLTLDRVTDLLFDDYFTAA
jgi:hypothetical protein